MNPVLALALLGTLITGCTSHQATWTMVGGPEIVVRTQIELDWPATWMKFTPSESDSVAKKEGTLLFVTRDGPGLQIITLRKTLLEEGFVHTQKKASPNMRMQELAELVLDDIRGNPDLMDVELIENGPAILGGRPAFRLVVAYRNKGGIKRQNVVYGIIVENALYRLTYGAPRRHYFELDLPTFEAVKTSWKWRGGPT